MRRDSLPRPGSGALVVLGHALLAFAMLHHGVAPERGADPPPPRYIELAFIAPSSANVPAAAEPPPIAVPRLPVRRPAATATVEPAPFAATGPAAVEIPAAVEVAAAGTPAAAPQPGRIDMESLRAVARQVDSEHGPVGLEPLRASDDSDLSRAVRKAKRPDCQTKYSGGTSFDVLLLIPLAIETVTDKGCKW